MCSRQESLTFVKDSGMHCSLLVLSHVYVAFVISYLEVSNWVSYGLLLSICTVTNPILLTFCKYVCVLIYQYRLTLICIFEMWFRRQFIDVCLAADNVQEQIMYYMPIFRNKKNHDFMLLWNIYLEHALTGCLRSLSFGIQWNWGVSFGV